MSSKNSYAIDIDTVILDKVDKTIRWSQQGPPREVTMNDLYQYLKEQFREGPDELEILAKAFDKKDGEWVVDVTKDHGGLSASGSVALDLEATPPVAAVKPAAYGEYMLENSFTVLSGIEDD